MTNTGEFVPKPMPLPPLPKLKIPENVEDVAIADAPKIDLTPIETPSVRNDKPTEDRIDSFKPLMWVAIATLGLIGFSFLQGGKTISTEIQNAAPQTQDAAVAGSNEMSKPVAPQKALPLPERDPDKVKLSILLLSNLMDGKNAQDQLVEARASFHRLQNQQLSQRSPQDYSLYLAGQREKVNLALQNQVRLNQTTLVGTKEQIAIASELLIESQSISLEQLRLKVAKGEITDIPDELRSRLIPTAVSPYVRLGAFARDSDKVGDLDKMLLLADREQDENRVANLEAQRLQAAQAVKQPQILLPLPKDAKK